MRMIMLQYFNFESSLYICSLDVNFFSDYFFFLGALYGLDNNWDGIELILAHYNNNMPSECSTLLSCVCVTGIIVIILLASSLNLMDKQIENVSRKISDNKSDNNNKIPMNLVWSQDTHRGGNNTPAWSFVYNQRDPSGAHLGRLFIRPEFPAVRYIDGVEYHGYLYQTGVLSGSLFLRFNYPGTKVTVFPTVLQELQRTHTIYSGFVESNPPLPCVGYTLFLRQFYDRAHTVREDSYISDYESEGD